MNPCMHAFVPPADCCIFWLYSWYHTNSINKLPGVTNLHQRFDCYNWPVWKHYLNVFVVSAFATSSFPLHWAIDCAFNTLTNEKRYCVNSILTHTGFATTFPILNALTEEWFTHLSMCCLYDSNFVQSCGVTRTFTSLFASTATSEFCWAHVLQYHGCGDYAIVLKWHDGPMGLPRLRAIFWILVLTVSIHERGNMWKRPVPIKIVRLRLLVETVRQTNKSHIQIYCNFFHSYIGILFLLLQFVGCSIQQLWFNIIERPDFYGSKVFVCRTELLQFYKHPRTSS